jgi:tetratricopeptide (TPR) repeat protein
VTLPDFDALWDYSHPAETEERFRDLLPAAETCGDASYLAGLLTQIGRAQGLAERFDEAHRTLDRVETLLRGDIPVAHVRYLLERGRVLNSSSRTDESKTYFLEAWEMARAQGEDFYAIDAAHMLGIVEPPEQQLAWSALALEAAEGSDEPRARTWLGPLYHNMGWTYHDLGRYEEALDLFRRGFAWRQKQGQQRETRIAALAIARCLRSLGRLEEALDLQRENLHAASEAGDAGGEVEEEIGECLLALGRSTEARQHFRRAHNALSQDAWLIEHETARLERLEALARS